jgi:hypothetical protein
MLSHCFTFFTRCFTLPAGNPYKWALFALPPSVQIGVALSRAPIGSLRRAWQLG